MPTQKTDEQPSQLPKPAPVRNWLWLWLCLTGMAMVSAAGGGLLAVSFSSTPLLQRHLTPQEEAVFGKGGSLTSSNLRLPELTRPVNILVMGMSVLTADVGDPPPGSRNLGYEAQVNSFDGLSDVMMLLRFDPETKKINVLSIPRDTRIETDGYGVIKINATNVNGGPAGSAKAVSRLLGGVQIDRYLRVNVGGVQKLVDALGGVTVYVPKDMKYQDESQHLYINLKKGRQHLNGDQTLQLLRFRHDQDGDIGRIERQQMVMRALMEQSLSPTTVTRFPEILSVIQSHLDTNLSVEELVALVGFAVKTDRSKVQMITLPGEFNGNGRHDISYWLPNYRGIQQMMAQYFAQDSNSALIPLPVNSAQDYPTESRTSVRDKSTDSLNSSENCTGGAQASLKKNSRCNTNTAPSRKKTVKKRHESH